MCFTQNESLVNFKRQVSVQFSSVAKPHPVLCDPMNCSTPGLPIHHQLLEFTQTHVHWVSDAIQPSHPGSIWDGSKSLHLRFILLWNPVPSQGYGVPQEWYPWQKWLGVTSKIGWQKDCCLLSFAHSYSLWGILLPVERPTCQELREVSSQQPAWSYSTHLSCTQIPDPQKLR